jgi:hypothetical protein
MMASVGRIPGSLRALLSNLIDYAGLYPPAGLSLARTAENYERYLASPESWILNRLVLPAAKLREAPVRAGWRVTLLVDDDPGPLPAEVETLETKMARRFALPTYCESPLDAIPGGAFAKVRTGGLTPETVPGVNEVAGFLHAATARRMPFKATAGLHHPVRSERALTYEAASPRATMHGFLNVFTASALAWHGADRDTLREALEEMEARAFQFGEGELRWRGRVLTSDQIAGARRDFAHSFGSCSFEEPVADLRELGLLP